MRKRGSAGAVALIGAQALVWLVCAAAALGPFASAHAAEPIVVGLNADVSSINEAVGRAIERGALLAIEEINAAGGVLGRPLELSVRDHRRNPARGVANVEAFAADERVVAILGGKHTPVILGELDTIHRLGVPYLIPWAAGTDLIDHGYRPSYTFRLSVRDAYAGQVLIEHAVHARGAHRVGLVLEQTGWGRSSESALLAALTEVGLQPVRVEWHNWGQTDFTPTIERLREAGAELIVFVGNAPEGVELVRAMERLPRDVQLPIISHWGVVGDALEQLLDTFEAEIDIDVLTTFSFADPPFPERAAPVLARYLERFANQEAPIEVAAMPGVAHAYDLVHILALAIERAGSTDRAAVRDALEALESYQGLVRDYAPPFSAERHDALEIGRAHV